MNADSDPLEGMVTLTGLQPTLFDDLWEKILDRARSEGWSPAQMTPENGQDPYLALSGPCNVASADAKEFALAIRAYQRNFNNPSGKNHKGEPYDPNRDFQGPDSREQLQQVHDLASQGAFTITHRPEGFPGIPIT
jgi:hypothetical protein